MESIQEYCTTNDLDHIYQNGECLCPDDYYELGYEQHLANAEDKNVNFSHYYWICKENNDYTYWLIHDCPCVSVSPSSDTAIVLFYHEKIRDDWPAQPPGDKKC